MCDACALVRGHRVLEDAMVWKKKKRDGKRVELGCGRNLAFCGREVVGFDSWLIRDVGAVCGGEGVRWIECAGFCGM